MKAILTFWVTLFLFISCVKKNNETNDSLELQKNQIELNTNWDGRRLFNSTDNPFMQPIPDIYAKHPFSDTMISLIRSSCGINATNTYVLATDYATPVFLADSNSNVVDIPITLYNKPPGKGIISGVPYPSGASPAGGSDKHLAIISKATSCIHEFWLFQGKTAGSGNAISINTNGIYADGRSTVAAGWSQLQGLIWPKELRDGEIRHALTFTVPVTNANGHVLPATIHDGNLANNPHAIPEGTLIRIKPDIIIDTINGIGTTEKIIYKAIQRYGMYCGDTNGGGLALRAVHTKSFPLNAYAPAFTFDPEFGNYYLKKFPFHLLEVVFTGDLQTQNSQPLVNQSCAIWK